MNPISPPNLISRGILIYFPPSSFNREEGAGELVTNIYYSETNPKYSWLSCNTKEQLISRITTQYNLNGVIVHYNSSTNLRQGFYTVATSIVLRNKNRKGSITIGLLESTPYLIIGTPYSSYSPLVLS
jgi:hypothetical protein